MKRILIVEDDVEQCLQLSEYLGEFGFATAVADNGLRALAILDSIPDNEPLPCVILLDLLMPEMNGWELQSKLSAHPRYCHIPIIVISCAPDRTDVPAKMHFAKPLDPRALIAALKN